MRLKGNDVGEPDVFEKKAIFGCSRACVVGSSHICDSSGSHSRIDAKLAGQWGRGGDFVL